MKSFVFREREKKDARISNEWHTMHFDFQYGLLFLYPDSLLAKGLLMVSADGFVHCIEGTELCLWLNFNYVTKKKIF